MGDCLKYGYIFSANCLYGAIAGSRVWKIQQHILHLNIYEKPKGEHTVT